MLAAFDEQIRRHPQPDSDGAVERDGNVIRCVPVGDGWAGVLWSELDSGGADAVIAAQVERFAGLPRPWEWKHYSYDQPPDLADRLLVHGFTPRPPEALLVAEISDLVNQDAPPPGLEVQAVVDERGVRTLVRLHDDVFGGDHSAVGRNLLGDLAGQPTRAAAALVLAGQTPICGGRVEFHLGTDFASLWGGGTVAACRGRGAFRALVAHRAALAAARGYRYLLVDASADSRPILQRLGFAELATTTPFMHLGAT